MQSLRDEPVERVYIVDNSPDDSLRETVSKFPRAEYLHVENRGFGNAHNIAIQKAIKAGSDFHLILNPDVRWDSPILSRLAHIMHERPECALIQPRIVYPDGRLQHTCRLLPTPLDVFARRFLPSKLLRRRLNRYLLPDEAYDREFKPVYIQGSFMFLRTEALLQTGLFDERFFMYPEDIDLTRRIRRSYDTLYYPHAVIVHDHAAASSRFGRMMRIHIVNMCRYFNKWGWWHDPERRRLNQALLKQISNGKV